MNDQTTATMMSLLPLILIFVIFYFIPWVYYTAFFLPRNVKKEKPCLDYRMGCKKICECIRNCVHIGIMQLF